MKKQTLLLAVFCIFASAIFAQAPTVALLNIDTNLVTNQFITARILKLSGTGVWHVKIQTQEFGTSVWVDSDTSTQGGGITNVMVTSDTLNADRDYTIRAIAYSATYADTAVSTNTKTARTKPNAQPISILYTGIIPGLPKSGIISIASSVGLGSYAYGVDASNGNIVTDTTFGITGNVFDTVWVTNAPGALVPPILLVIKSNNGTSASISPVTSPAFYAPQLIGPDIENLTPFKNQDSIIIPLHIVTIGNGGPITVSYWVKDAISGSYVVAPLSQTVTNANSVIAVAKGGLFTNRLYEFHATAGNTYGLFDTVSLFIRTDQVPYAGTTITNVAPGTNTYAATWSVDPLGSYDSSSVRHMTITRNSIVLWDSAVSITVPTAITVSGIPGTPGTTHTDYLSVTNLAGLTTMIAYSVPMQSVPSNGKPTIGSITDVSPSEARLEGVYAHVASGNTATILVKTQNMNTGAIVSKVAQSHITTNGPIPNILVTGLEGNVNYCHTVVDSNELSGELIYSDQKCATTIPPIAPLLSDLTQDNNATTDDVLAVNFIGNSNGYQGVLERQLSLNNVPVGPSISSNVGTGGFNFPDSWNNLSANTEYKVFGQLETSTGSNQSPITKYFWTDAFTGVDEIPANAHFQKVRAIDIRYGQDIMTGTYNDVFPKLLGTGLLVAIIPVDDHGNRTGKPRKQWFLK